MSNETKARVGINETFESKGFLTTDGKQANLLAIDANLCKEDVRRGILKDNRVVLLITKCKHTMDVWVTRLVDANSGDH